jgi:hypothetical protein
LVVEGRGGDTHVAVFSDKVKGERGGKLAVHEGVVVEDEEGGRSRAGAFSDGADSCESEFGELAGTSAAAVVVSVAMLAVDTALLASSDSGEEASAAAADLRTFSGKERSRSGGSISDTRSICRLTSRRTAASGPSGA